MPLNERIQHVVEELSAIQRELNDKLMAGGSDDFTGKPPAVAVDPDGVRNLKIAADQLRHFLWFYLQANAPESEAGRDTLQLLRQVASNVNTFSQSSPYTFLERLSALTEYALVHYRADEHSRQRPN